MAQVRASGGQQSPYIDELLAAQAMAETQGLGVFTKVLLGLSCLSRCRCCIVTDQILTLYPASAGPRSTQNSSQEYNECR